MKYAVATLNKKSITDFAKERNDLFKKASENWVLFLDSDEILSEELKTEIYDLGSKIYDYYYLKRKNFFLGKYVGTDKIIRLVKKGSGMWVRAVHETFQPSHLLRVKALNGCLIHNTADNLFDYLNKINIYSSLHATANKKEGKKSNLVKIIFFPIFKFVQTYLKSKNIVFSIMASLHSFLAWSKQYLGEKKR